MNSDVMIGYCWPNDKVAYPDFLNNRTVSWWTQQILDYKKNVFNFDALWIDMNEPVGFRFQINKKKKKTR
jgi:alpha-glucosidase (family GH31 glycosyl hydrolase)